jgi:hypothetical protein
MRTRFDRKNLTKKTCLEVRFGRAIWCREKRDRFGTLPNFGNEVDTLEIGIMSVVFGSPRYETA